MAVVALGHWTGGSIGSGRRFSASPAFGLASGVVNNEGCRIVKNGVILFALPLAVSAAPQLARRILALLPNGIATDSTGQVVLALLLTAGLWAVFSGLAEIPSRIVGKWSMPERVHEVVCKVFEAFAYSLAVLTISIAFWKTVVL